MKIILIKIKIIKKYQHTYRICVSDVKFDAQSILEVCFCRSSSKICKRQICDLGRKNSALAYTRDVFSKKRASRLGESAVSM